MSCDKVVEEARNIVKVCQEVQEHMDSVEREEIFNLLALVETNRPSYTAANYFVLDRTSLFALLNATTTYFIILVQFYQKTWKKAF